VGGGGSAGVAALTTSTKLKIAAVTPSAVTNGRLGSKSICIAFPSYRLLLPLPAALLRRLCRVDSVFFQIIGMNSQPKFHLAALGDRCGVAYAETGRLAPDELKRWRKREKPLEIVG
jgi:hypothetical protein